MKKKKEKRKKNETFVKESEVGRGKINKLSTNSQKRRH
jgi:hypothetical protein